MQLNRLPHLHLGACCIPAALTPCRAILDSLSCVSIVRRRLCPSALPRSLSAPLVQRSELFHPVVFWPWRLLSSRTSRQLFLSGQFPEFLPDPKPISNSAPLRVLSPHIGWPTALAYPARPP